VSFKHKKMRQRQARSAALLAGTEPDQVNPIEEAATVPAWADLVKMGREEIAALMVAKGIESSGNLMKDRAALNKAR